MHVIHATNVNDALYTGVEYLKRHGLREDSRNGAVLVAPVPVTTQYLRPQERVLFSAQRNANPFFHVLESLWMLAGRNDVAYPHTYAPMMLYSDDTETLNGAYGYRWREHFGYDQLREIINELKRNPASRRCVLSMWDAMDEVEGYEGDLKRAIAGGKDVPCNTHVYFRVNAGALDMTVCNRSNDIIWGAYGANAVHFSVLQEYVADLVGVKGGAYYQMANNFHAYIEREDVVKLFNTSELLLDDRYRLTSARKVRPTPLGAADSKFYEEVLRVLDGEEHLYSTEFCAIAHEMDKAYKQYKAGDLSHAILRLSNRGAHNWDWLSAGHDWLLRIAEKRALKVAGGVGGTA